MPSHFHSTCHSSRGSPSVSIGSSSGDARQNGYGRERIVVRVLVRRAARRTSRRSASTRPSAAPRRSAPASSAACASARTTSVCETPTRNSPVSSLSRMNRSSRSSARHQPMTSCAAVRRGPARAAAGSALRPTRRAADPRRRSAGELVEHERGCLGAVADHRVALVEQPALEARGRQRPLANRAPTGAAASAGGRSERTPPTRHRPAARREVADHRGDLGVGRGRPVDRVEERGEPRSLAEAASPPTRSG